MPAGRQLMDLSLGSGPGVVVEMKAVKLGVRLRCTPPTNMKNCALMMWKRSWDSRRKCNALDLKSWESFGDQPRGNLKYPEDLLPARRGTMCELMRGGRTLRRDLAPPSRWSEIGILCL